MKTFVRENPLIVIEEITMALPDMKNVYEDTVANIADNLRQYATVQLPKLLELVASKDEGGKLKLKLVEAFNSAQFGIKPATAVVANTSDKATSSSSFGQ
jgi:hypothetical protein